MDIQDKVIKINGQKIGTNFPPYIIAEMSANHNGSLKRALETVEMAKLMGANAIKIQTYTPDTITIDCNKDDFIIKGGLWDNYNLYDLYKWAQTPFEWHKEIFDHAKKIGITCFSTPFDETAVDLLEDLNAPAYKIASFEAIDLPLIKYVSQTRKPLIISTGMATLDEISELVETSRNAGCKDLILLHCVSGYPAPFDQSNLQTIPDIEKRFGVITGLSDHTLGTATSIASIALGAKVIEKHVTLSRKDNGPDSTFSLEPEELKLLCDSCNIAWQSLGKAGYERKKSEQENVKFRRSIYAVKDIKEDEPLTKENIRRIRPGFGLHPRHYESILGRKASTCIEKGTALSFKMFH